jgi:hypothetical protein
MAELGFLGVIVRTRVTTPFACGFCFKAAVRLAGVFFVLCERTRSDCAMVVIFYTFIKL